MTSHQVARTIYSFGIYFVLYLFIQSKDVQLSFRLGFTLGKLLQALGATHRLTAKDSVGTLTPTLVVE